MLYVIAGSLVCVVLPIVTGMIAAGGKSDCTAFDEPALVCPCLQCSRGKQG